MSPYPGEVFVRVRPFSALNGFPLPSARRGTQILNFLVFVPLGLIGTRLGWSPRTVALVGAGTSALTELLQLFSTRRYPSVTDLILNIAGTLTGIAVAISWQSAVTVSAQRRASTPVPEHDP